MYTLLAHGNFMYSMKNKSWESYVYISNSMCPHTKAHLSRTHTKKNNSFRLHSAIVLIYTSKIPG